MELDLPSMEEKWKKHWLEHDIYRYDASVRDRSRWFAIDTPPPTISGKMHMGHAFSYPHQDFIARYKRMRGFEVYYPWGFDDNGLPTERYTEKTLGIKGERTDLLEFIRLCNEESEKAEAELLQGWLNLGLSADFRNSIRTSSPESKKISQKMFLDLVKKERVYREEAPTLRCPTCRTAISQIELKDQTLSTEFIYLNFGTPDNHLTIATTRPELIGACVAIVVNPNDDRYRNMVGKNVKVPFYGHEVPVIADEYAVMDKGTGAEMLCTFGDQNDLALWRKYSHLGLRVIIDGRGRMNELSGDLAGMSIQEARKTMVQKVKDSGLVEKIERVKHSVNTHERCDTPIEISISKKWSVRYMDLKEELKSTAASVKWIPEHMKIRLDNWIDGLKWDWLISRQRFFGVPFPVWYCKNCSKPVFAEENELPVDPRLDQRDMECQHCGGKEFEPDTDIMDTWATSSLTPRLYLINDDLFDLLYPMDTRFQGHDIINFWAFTTLVRSYLHDGIAPWENITISGNVYDPLGQKMSKSKGNIMEPASLIAQYGADSVRYWASTTIPGEDIKVKEQDFVRGRRTIIKMLNAANLVKIITGAEKAPLAPENVKFPVNRWILGKLNSVIETGTAYMDQYQVSRARAELDNFFWNVFCDNYLELAKSVNNRKDTLSGEMVSEVAKTLNYVLLQTMKMYAPVLPFITEEIYHSHNLGEKESIHLEQWPTGIALEITDKEISDFDYVISVIAGIRAFKTERKLSMSAQIGDITIAGEQNLILENSEIIRVSMSTGKISAVASQTLEVRETQ